MVQYLYDNYIILYTFAALCGLGLLLRFIVNLVYRHLVKESDRLGETKNKMLKHLKMKFSTCYKLKIGVNNVDTFVDKNVLKYRFCGVLLSTWDNICGQILYLILLIVPIISVFGVASECGQDQVLMNGAVGILASAVLIFVDKSMNLAEKKKLLRLNLLDYLENFCKVRLEQEAVNPELLEQYRREYFQPIKTGKQSETAATAELMTDGPKDELNRRRQARLKKEEERKLQAAKREEEQRKAEEIRKEEERRKLEERRQQAARRREEERQKMEEEREALEARRIELKKKAEEKQGYHVQRLKKSDEKQEILKSIEEDLKPTQSKTNVETLMKGLDEIAAEQEEALLERKSDSQPVAEQAEPEKMKKSLEKNNKSRPLNLQEEKLIEDVLKEFFA